MMFRSWLPAVAILFLTATVSFGGKKDKQTLPPPPPMPQAQDVAIYRGRSIEIPLRAIGRSPGQLRFLIRTQPRHGTLGPIQIIDFKNAVVTYTHDEKSSVSSDTFSFAVQGPDSPVSAPGVIALTISEEPPAFSVVREVDFGTVTLGNTRSEEIVLTNSGGGVLAGRITVPPPWRIAGNEMYRLGRKESQKVRLVFAPADDDEFNGQLRFSHDSKVFVTLSGTGFAPLAFEPAKELSFTENSSPARRTAILTLQNRMDAARSVELEYPENLIGPEQLFLKPQEEKSISIEINPIYLGNLDSSITIASEGYRVTLPAKAYALKPILILTPENAFSFGRMTPGEHKEAAFELKNSGGSPARLKIALPQELIVSPDPATAVIPPGESRKFAATLELSKAGVFQSAISIDYGGDGPLTLPIQADATANAAVPSLSLPANIKSDTASVQPGGTQAEQQVTILDPQEPAGNDIPPIKEFNHFRTGTHEIEIGWKIPARNAISYAIEWRQVSAPVQDGPPVVSWNEWRGVQTTENNGSVIARFPNLKDGRTWHIRIRTVDELGKKSASSPIFIISTKADTSLGLLGWVLILAAVGGIVAAIVFWRKQRMAVVDDESARISALENK